MERSYYSKLMEEFLQDENILGKLTKNPQFSSDGEQRNAWMEQIDFLKKVFKNLKSGHIIFEYVIPRMGKRADVILIYSGLVFVIEFKVGAEKYEKSAIDQVWDYALDLKNFQKASHNIKLVPILVATSAPNIDNTFEQDDDGDFRFSDGTWIFNQFRGSKWMKIKKKSNMDYLKNAYRVLLTRARQGMIIFIPKGNASDHTRDPKYYDETYEYLKKVGIQEI